MKFSYPIGHTECIGRAVIRKVKDYGYKYRVFYGSCFRQFATIKQAREFAQEDYVRNH